MLNAVQEIYFWTGIMRDHSEFFLSSLSSRECEFARTAQHFKDCFTGLHEEAGSILKCQVCNPELAVRLANKSMSLLIDFVNYKRFAIRRLLNCEIELALPPTFVNHMINEAMEFCRNLYNAQYGVPAAGPSGNLQLHKIWLPDAAGHAASIAADLDPTETQLIEKAEIFKKEFDSLFIKSDELSKMLERSCLDNGALDWLNTEVNVKINEFIRFLKQIMVLRLKCKALGTIKPLVPNHMIREEKYYLFKIAQSR